MCAQPAAGTVNEAPLSGFASPVSLDSTEHSEWGAMKSMRTHRLVM